MNDRSIDLVNDLLVTQAQSDSDVPSQGNGIAGVRFLDAIDRSKLATPTGSCSAAKKRLRQRDRPLTEIGDGLSKRD